MPPSQSVVIASYNDTLIFIDNTYQYKQNALRTPVVIIPYCYGLHPLPDGFRSRIANALKARSVPPASITLLLIVRDQTSG